MSVQFVFWRTSKSLNSSKVYDRLMRGKSVRGLETLDLDAIETALISAFPSWEVEVRRTAANQQTMIRHPDGNGALDIGYTSQSVVVTCYGTSASQWNDIIEVMAAQKLPLYDPQVGERFDRIPL